MDSCPQCTELVSVPRIENQQRPDVYAVNLSIRRPSIREIDRRICCQSLNQRDWQTCMLSIYQPERLTDVYAVRETGIFRHLGVQLRTPILSIMPWDTSLSDSQYKFFLDYVFSWSTSVLWILFSENVLKFNFRHM